MSEQYMWKCPYYAKACRKWPDECQRCEDEELKDAEPPQTNGDRIRAMSDEMLAIEYTRVNNCCSCRFGNVCEATIQSSRCIKLLTDWYKSPAEEV